MKKKPNIKFYTAQKININENVNKGFTKIFKNFSDAEDYAKKKRSYLYSVYAQRLINNKYSESYFYGFGVPK